MSHIASYWAIEQRGISMSAKMVLMVLADYHNSETGGCFPSKAALAEKCCCTERTIVNATQELALAGLISLVSRQDEVGRQRSNQYLLNIQLGEGEKYSRGRVKETAPLEQVIYNQEDTVPSELHDPLIAFSSNYEEPPVSEQAEFWAEAKVIFEGWRIPDKRANPLIGKLLKMSGGNYSEVRRLLEEAIANDVTDPVPWLIAAVSGKNKRGKEAKKKQIADAFAELEAASERRKAEWREQYGTEYGVYPDTGEGGGNHNELLQPEPPTESKPVHSERSKSVVKVPAKRVAQIVRPNRGDTNQGQIRPIHSGTGGGGGETNEAWQ